MANKQMMTYQRMVVRQGRETRSRTMRNKQRNNAKQEPR